LPDQLIDRRKTLKYFGLLASTAAGREFLESWLPRQPADAATSPDMTGMGHHAPPEESRPDTPYAPQFFKPDEYRTVEALTEIIIPTDDKPGAKEAEVARFIDFLVFSAAEFRPSMQKEWASGLGTLDRLSRRKFTRPFLDLTEKERAALLTEMSLPERDPKAEQEGYEFYRLLKETTVEAFYSSRVGLIDVLGYQGLTYLREFPGCTHPEHH
jgi:gluconate 2-dehydrogenase subunit 3-like protein